MKTQNIFLAISIFLLVCVGIALGSFFHPKKTIPAKINSDQVENFNNDLTKASDYWAHNKRGSESFRNGDYENAVNEYKKAIEVIENMSGDKWPNLKKEDVDRMNANSRIERQFFSRYGLVEALEKAGKYEEALQNVDWLTKNQQIKGKEELLKSKLNSMKRRFLRLMNPNPKDPTLTYQDTDYVWDQVRLAEEVQEHKKTEEALEYYKKGFNGSSGIFDNISPERQMCATYIILLNRELGRHDDALSMVNFIDSKTIDIEEKKILQRVRQGILDDKKKIPDAVPNSQ